MKQISWITLKRQIEQGKCELKHDVFGASPFYAEIAYPDRRTIKQLVGKRTKSTDSFFNI